MDTGGRLAATVFALRNCDVVALALSPNAVKTSAIIDELTLAEQAYKRVIPLVLESMTLPPEIAKPLRYASKINCASDFPGGVNELLRTDDDAYHFISDGLFVPQAPLSFSVHANAT